jgi:hypothetical protein
MVCRVKRGELEIPEKFQKVITHRFSETRYKRAEARLGRSGKLASRAKRAIERGARD